MRSSNDLEGMNGGREFQKHVENGTFDSAYGSLNLTAEILAMSGIK